MRAGCKKRSSNAMHADYNPNGIIDIRGAYASLISTAQLSKKGTDQLTRPFPRPNVKGKKRSGQQDYTSLAWPDPFRTSAYRLEIISALQRGAYNLQSISACAERVWLRETKTIHK